MSGRKSLWLTFILIFCFFSAACGSPQSEQDSNEGSDKEEEILEEDGETPPVSEPTQKPPLLATLENMDPEVEVFFDGIGCRVEGPDQITPGEHNFILHNASELDAHLWVAQYTGEGSFEGHLAWREQNDCGHPGARCENENGSLISYPNIKWFNAVRHSQDGISIYYKIYELASPGEYLVYIGSNNLGWLCSPFLVGN